ncbi:MAG: DUF177 domain-containing protein [Candidatus Omnitrophica bacterium]|nr:DUF177 domain-containing protein [Candidatus Omnitrophota bacterium]
MKVDLRQIPSEGLILTEEFSPKSLDLDTDLIKFIEPLRAKAVISKSYNAVHVSLSLSSRISISCGRCLKEGEEGFNRTVALDYAVDKESLAIELDPDIREEIILEYPINPLCKVDCKGLCPECGGNLNEGGCNCGTT